MLERGGVRGNRRFWLVDARGRLFNGKRGGPMVRIRPEWDEETRVLALTFPGGRRVEGVVELVGYVTQGEALRELYRSHDAFVHVAAIEIGAPVHQLTSCVHRVLARRIHERSESSPREQRLSASRPWIVRRR